jgi:expansin (peptidoglycan-binding protein)
LSYVLVNRFDEIVHTCDSESLDEAKNFFISVKQIDEEKFNNLWKVMKRDEYDTNLKNAIRKPSSEGYQWWEEDKVEIDEALSGKDGLG